MHWEQFAEGCLGPLLRFPPHPFLMARFGLAAVQPAQMLAAGHLGGVRARALFAGLAAHSFLAFDQPLSSAAGLMLGIAAHAVGWPIPQGGAGAITRALIAQLQSLGGTLHTSRPDRCEVVSRIGRRDDADSVRHRAARAARHRRRPAHAWLSGARIGRFRRAPGAFKIDYALSASPFLGGPLNAAAPSPCILAARLKR